MPKPRANSLDATVRKVLQKVVEVDNHQKRLLDILTTSDPGSAVAADAYEGLRRQVTAASSERMAHLSQLVQLRHTVANVSSVEEVAKHIDGWMEMADLRTVTDIDDPDADTLFEVLGGDGDGFEVLEPAYVDGRSGRVVRQGRVRRITATVAAGAEADEAVEGESS